MPPIPSSSSSNAAAVKPIAPLNPFGPPDDVFSAKAKDVSGNGKPKDAFDDYDDDDDDGWLDMPIIREDTSLSGLDEEDQKKYHYQHRPTSSSFDPSSSSSSSGAGDSSSNPNLLTSTNHLLGNATGTLIDIDDSGASWRSKLDRGDESTYTRLRAIEEDDIESDEVHMRTKYLFDEDKAMTPLSQMQATKELLTEAQRMAYVGLCALMCGEMVGGLRGKEGRGGGGEKAKGGLWGKKKEVKGAVGSMELWALKIMGRLYYHMELETQEQKMIESLADHGVLPSDLVPALMTTHTVANPEYDPEEAAREEEDKLNNLPDDDETSISDQTLVDEPTTPTQLSHPLPPPTTPPTSPPIHSPTPGPIHIGTTTTKILPSASLPPSTLPGTHTPLTTQSLSRTCPVLTLDIRWTILCDLFLILIADSVYDARSRVLLEHVAYTLGLGWLDVVRFEKRVSEALEIQEDVETLRNEEVVEEVRKKGRGRRYMMLGLATLGGGLVIGLSAGLLAPVIGLGLAGALTTVGVTGTGAFLGGTAGAAVITTGGVLTGSGIAVRGMAKRTQQVRTFDILPLHNNKRVNCILTVPGFMNGLNDDVRLPFSVLDPIVGDVFSILWEPEMIRETGSALQILTGEVLSQIGMTVLQATVMTGLMSALQWPIILTKLGYLIDNPWSNALDRAKAAGKVLADVLLKRHMGVRPISLIGFSLGARVIFYALLELAQQKAYGIVQDVFLLGATLTVSSSLWIDTRSIVSGRYVNAFARNDWVLNYLFRATSGGVGTVAGLRPIMGVQGLENVDVTDKIAGHMSYRTFMPLILDQLGFPVFADFFDEPEEPDFDGERIVERDEDSQKTSGGSWFSRKKKEPSGPQRHVVRPPSTSGFVPYKKKSAIEEDAVTLNGSISEKEEKVGEEGEEELPPRIEHGRTNGGAATPTPSRPGTPSNSHSSQTHGHPKEHSESASATGSKVPIHAGFDLGAIKSVLKEVEGDKPSSVATSTAVPIPFAPHSNPNPNPNSTTISSSLASGTASVLAPPSSLLGGAGGAGKTGSAPSTPATKKRGFFARLSSSPSASASPSPSPGPGHSPANTPKSSSNASHLTISTPPGRSHSTPPTQVWDTPYTGTGVRRSLDEGGQGQYVDVPEMGVDERGLRTTGGMGMGMGMGSGGFGVGVGVGADEFGSGSGFGGGSEGGGLGMPLYSRSMSSFPRLEDPDVQSRGALSVGAMALASSSGMGPSGMHAAFLSSLPDEIVPSWGPSSSSSSSLNVTTPTTAKPFSSTSSSTIDYPSSFSYSSSSSSSGFGTTPTTPFSNPFTSANHDRTPVLSFGGALGVGDEEEDIGSSISTSSSSANKNSNSNSMAWELPPLQRKKTVDTNGIGASANPWS